MTISSLVGKGLYSVQEASQLIRVPSNKLHRWAFGYKTKQKTYTGLWERSIPEVDAISFHDLLELKLVYKFTQCGLSLKLIREAAKIAREEFNTIYPFTRQTFHTDGEAIFVKAAKSVDETPLINIITKQYVLEKIYDDSFLASVDYSAWGDAERWYPLSEQGCATKTIVLDPNRLFGQPILTESGVPTRILSDAYKAGDSLSVIAYNYCVPEATVEQAVMYEAYVQDSV